MVDSLNDLDEEQVSDLKFTGELTSPLVGNADYLGLAQKREDAAGHIGTVNSGSVWTRLNAVKVKPTHTKNDN